MSKLVARCRAEGEAAFAPRFRRPKSSPTVIGPDVVELMVAARKQLAPDGRAGADVNHRDPTGRCPTTPPPQRPPAGRPHQPRKR